MKEPKYTTRNMIYDFKHPPMDEESIRRREKTKKVAKAASRFTFGTFVVAGFVVNAVGHNAAMHNVKSQEHFEPGDFIAVEGANFRLEPDVTERGIAPNICAIADVPVVLDPDSLQEVTDGAYPDGPWYEVINHDILADTPCAGEPHVYVSSRAVDEDPAPETIASIGEETGE